MDSVGDYLRTKREEQGLSIEDVADETNIAKRYLTALENEEYEQLPAEVYVRGFLRTYCRMLEVDGNQVIEAYDSSRPEEEPEKEPEDSERRLSVLLLYWGAMILVLGLAIVVILLRFGWVTPERARELNQPAVPDTRAVEETNAKTAEAVEELVIDVQAVERTWLLITYDGYERQQQMLHADQTTTWRAEETLLLRVGNAGGLRLFHRGRELPSLGESGEVVDVVINLDDGEAELRQLSESEE